MEFVKRLNQPILEVSEGNRAYTIYFDAYKSIDSSHAGAAAALDSLYPERSNYDDALQWAAESSQRDAIDMLLAENDLGYNAPNYELFGLPYGEENVPMELADYEFVVYVDDAQLRFAEFAYLPRYEELIALLNAEMHYQAHDGNTEASAEAAVAMVRMARQLSERQFYSEKVQGLQWIRTSCTRIRELIWIYRDVFAIEDLRIISDALEDLDLDQLKFPQGEVVNLEQIVWQIFRGEAEGDYFADKDKFPRIMAEFESQDQPLLRFEAAHKWKALAEEHATRVEVLDKLTDAFNNWRLRWRLDPYDRTLDQYESEFASLHPIKYAVVTESLKLMETLFDQRIPVYADVNGTACACGVLAFMIKEGGQLTPGEIADVGTIPDKLAQIQPAYVGDEEMLRDWYDKDEGKLRYATVINRQETQYVTFSYYTETPDGRVKLPEHWPILYSIGQNLKDDVAATHTLDGSEGDIIYWPVVDLMPTE
ncbi:MAG: hypothetical protein HND57_06515 [Planctomycetes bacterium]|nr:hypothetical protein [Planctomycetota bacterium]